MRLSPQTTEFVVDDDAPDVVVTPAPPSVEDSRRSAARAPARNWLRVAALGDARAVALRCGGRGRPALSGPDRSGEGSAGALSAPPVVAEGAEPGASLKARVGGRSGSKRRGGAEVRRADRASVGRPRRSRPTTPPARQPPVLPAATRRRRRWSRLRRPSRRRARRRLRRPWRRRARRRLHRRMRASGSSSEMAVKVATRSVAFLRLQAQAPRLALAACALVLSAVGVSSLLVPVKAPAPRCGGGTGHHGPRGSSGR